jgi:flagellar assembly protein FliH
MSSAIRTTIPLERLRGRDARFSPLFAAVPKEDAGPSREPEPDPIHEAYARGLAEGRAEAEAQAAERERERDARRAAIELAFARFDAASADQLRERLHETVYALCEKTMLPLASDAERLALRVEKAAAMLQRAHDERRILLHPDDIALVDGRLPVELMLVPDPSLERGALRIETEDGGIEDGPSQWRRILAEAFREC